MHTPHPKFFCPRCRTAYDVDHNYCGRCGADMHHASRLHRAALLDEESGSHRTAQDTLTGESPAAQPAAGSNSGPPRVVRDRRVSPAHDPWLGKVVDSRYRVVDVLGRGGMGVVYKVEHQRMGKIAAMKVLHGDLAGDKEVTARFRREAEAVSRLTHPNTVQVFDFGTAQGQLYLVMEYVRGLDVGSLVDRDGPLPFERAAPLLGQVCAALTEAHELGVVHRDLKPENILVTRTHGGQDFAKVLDFGLAKLAEREEIAAVTGRGAIVGTPYYMSPEQIRGDDEVDARSDIYSLGALMYRLLTAEHAFNANSPVGVLTKHLTEAVTPPSVRAPGLHLPAQADQIVLRAMQKLPADRYPSVRDLLEDLDQAYAELHGHSTSSGRRPVQARANPVAATPRTLAAEVDYGIESDRRLRRADLDAYERALLRRRWVGIVSLPLAIAAVVVGGYYYLHWRGQQPQRHEREANDDIGEATLIGSGLPVEGHIGKRRSRQHSDRDFFRLREVPDRDGADRLNAELGGLPNMDVGLYLYEAGGRLVAQANEGGVGEPERIRDYRVRAPVVLMVSEVRVTGVLPTENVSDRYRLVAAVDRARRNGESEPNESESDANQVAAGVAIQGYLDRRDDVDVFRFEGTPGRYLARVSGADAVPLAWRHGDVALMRREEPIDLAPGDLLWLARGDRGLPLGQPLPGADQPYTLSLAAAP